MNKYDCFDSVLLLIVVDRIQYSQIVVVEMYDDHISFKS